MSSQPVKLADRYAFGTRDHVALRMPPCTVSRGRYEFLRLLHPTGFTDLRAIHKEDDSKNKAKNLVRSDVAGIEAFANTYGDREIYVGVASRATHDGRDLDHCLELHAVFTDQDFKDSSEGECRARLAAFQLKPSMIVNSGGGLHSYWLLLTPINLRTHAAFAEMLLKSLCQELQADPLSAEPARILRLPGTFNHKYGEPRPVVVESFDDTCRYSIDELTAVLSPVPDEPEQEEDTEPIAHGLSREVRMRLAGTWLADQAAAVQGEHGDGHTYQVCCTVAHGYDLNLNDALAVLTDWNARCQPPWKEGDLRKKIRSATKSAKGARGGRLLLILNVNDPLPSAHAFVARHYIVDDTVALRHQTGVFYGYQPSLGAYHERDEPAVRADLYKFLERSQQWIEATKKEPRHLSPFQPTKFRVDNVLDALKAVCNLPTSQRPPCWLNAGVEDFDPLDLLACPNGLLHIPTRQLHSPSARFFTLNGIEFNYDPWAPEASEWLAFLKSLWSDDEESINTLQEMFGYVLVPDTRFQKIFLIIGPPRGGKGVIARILTRLVGTRNVCNPTLAAFGRDFGKQVLVAKTLAIIADARIGHRTDTASVAEALLAISGEDNQTIERKFLPDWNGKLLTRFLLLSNELPHIGEASGALTKRFIVWSLKKSFYGNEDLGLFDRLVLELPAILNWALVGRDRLYKRGYFMQPNSANELIETFTNLSSPEAAFLSECTEQKAGKTVTHQELFDMWKIWCERNGRDKSGTLQTFGRNVRAALPWITMRRLGEKGNQTRCWEGLELTEHPPPAPTLPGN